MVFRWKKKLINIEWDLNLLEDNIKDVFRIIKKNKVKKLKSITKKIKLTDDKQINRLFNLITKLDPFFKSDRVELFNKFLNKLCDQGFLKPVSGEHEFLISGLKDFYFNKASYGKPLIPNYFTLTRKSKKITFSYYSLNEKVEDVEKRFLYALAEELDLLVASVSYYKFDYDEWIDKGLIGTDVRAEVIKIREKKPKIIFLGVINTLTGFKGNKIGMDLLTKFIGLIARSKSYIGIETGELSISSYGFMKEFSLLPPISYKRKFKSKFMKKFFGKRRTVKTYFYPIMSSIKFLQTK